MSEENKNKNTNNRNFASADMGKLQKVKLEYSGDLYVITESELTNLWMKMEKVEKLEHEIGEYKRALSEEVSKNKELVKNIEEWKTAYSAKEKEVETCKNELEKMKTMYSRAVENYNALLEEYKKLKVFKENAGRGRAPALTPEQVGFVRHWAMQGKNSIEIHGHLTNNGVNVSYETVRKIVAEMKKR